MDLQATPRRLYLFQLATSTIPLPNGSLSMSSGCYLIQTSAGQNILIDSGLPPDYAPPPGSPPSENEKNVLEHLADLGLGPEDVHTVICTHFDIDHVGYHPSFPNAELVVQCEHYDLARDGHQRFAAGRAYWDDPRLGYRFVDGDVDLHPGLLLVKTPGHAPAHQSVLVRLPETGPVLLAIDAVVLQRLFTPERTPWPTDDNADDLRASTQKLLDLVARERVALTVFGHDGAQWRVLRKAPEFYE